MEADHLKKSWLWLLGSAFLISSGVALFSQFQRKKDRQIFDKALKIKEKEVAKANRELKKYSKTKRENTIDYTGCSKQSQSYEKIQEAFSARRDRWKIVITGGPCAGKTTAMTSIAQALEERHIKALVVPEAVTLLFKGGAQIVSTEFDKMQGARFQHALMKIQMNLEDQFMRVAQNHDGPVVILCDRGLLDGSAYVDSFTWSTVLDEIGINTIQMRDMRYHLVLHLVSAANGAQQFYDFSTNESRYEDVHNARLVDKKLIDAWIGHANFRIIDNNVSSFKLKIERCIKEVLRLVGLPTATDFYKKYLLFDSNQEEIQENCRRKFEMFTIEETYLASKGDGSLEQTIKMRTQGRHSGRIYTAIRRETRSKGRVVETQRVITARQYLFLLNSADPNRSTLVKRRISFGYRDHCYVLDRFLNKDIDFTLVRLVTSYTREEGHDKKYELPPFLKIFREVTDEMEYQVENIARKDWKMPSEDQRIITSVGASPKNGSH